MSIAPTAELSGHQSMQSLFIQHCINTVIELQCVKMTIKHTHEFSKNQPQLHKNQTRQKLPDHFKVIVSLLQSWLAS